jgi:hypothetical protein
MPVIPDSIGKYYEVNKIVRSRLEHALTDYDRKQSTRRGYNPYALTHYLGAISDAWILVSQGKSWEEALRQVLCDRVLDVALKAIGS